MTRGRTIHGGNSGAKAIVVGSVVRDDDDVLDVLYEGDGDGGVGEGSDEGLGVDDGSGDGEGSGEWLSSVVDGSVVNWVEKPVAFGEQTYLKSLLEAS